MKIREITIEDIPALLAMGRNEDGFKVAPEQAFWTEPQLKSWIETGEDVLLAAEHEGELVGFVLTALHRPTGKVTWENQLVLKKFRRLGVAQSLTLEMLKRLRANGATYLNFLVKTDNPHAAAYYESRGFGRGEDCVWFDMHL